MIESSISKDLFSNDIFLDNKLNINNIYDIKCRKLKILQTDVYIYFISSLVDSALSSEIIKELLKISNSDKNIYNIIYNKIVNLDVYEAYTLEPLVKEILAGRLVILVDGYEKAIIVDARKNPSRTPDEPPNDVSIRGSRDGFVEDIIINTALIRRRVRDERLHFDLITVGSISQMDVLICYLKDVADNKIINTIKNKLTNTKAQQIAMTEETIYEILFSGKLNPLPYTKITERPDVLAAEISKGYIGILSDNTPNALIVPITFFDLLNNIQQHKDNAFEGTLHRIINFITILLYITMLPIWLYFAMNPHLLTGIYEVFKVSEEYTIPIEFQVIGLMLLYYILGISQFNAPKLFKGAIQLSVTVMISTVGLETNILSPHTIFFSIITAIAAYAIPTRELQVPAFLLLNLLVISVILFGMYGYLIVLLLSFIFTATRKVFGRYYLYPLIPLNLKRLLTYIFRYPKSYK